MVKHRGRNPDVDKNAREKARQATESAKTNSLLEQQPSRIFPTACGVTAALRAGIHCEMSRKHTATLPLLRQSSRQESGVAIHVYKYLPVICHTRVDGTHLRFMLGYPQPRPLTSCRSKSSILSAKKHTHTQTLFDGNVRGTACVLRYKFSFFWAHTSTQPAHFFRVYQRYSRCAAASTPKRLTHWLATYATGVPGRARSAWAHQNPGGMIILNLARAHRTFVSVDKIKINSNISAIPIYPRASFSVRSF